MERRLWEIISESLARANAVLCCCAAVLFNTTRGRAAAAGSTQRAQRRQIQLHTKETDFFVAKHVRQLLHLAASHGDIDGFVVFGTRIFEHLLGDYQQNQ